MARQQSVQAPIEFVDHIIFTRLFDAQIEKYGQLSSSTAFRVTTKLKANILSWMSNSSENRAGSTAFLGSSRNTSTGIAELRWVPLTTRFLMKLSALNRFVLPDALPPYTTASGKILVLYFSFETVDEIPTCFRHTQLSLRSSFAFAVITSRKRRARPVTVTHEFALCPRSESGDQEYAKAPDCNQRRRLVLRVSANITIIEHA